MARVVGFLILAISAQAMAKFDVDPHQCLVIFDNFPYCMDFLIGSNDFPSSQCCQMGSRAICECIEIITRTIPVKLRADRISDLPVRCNTHLSFPISEYMDCNR
ncbi:non-specific lipid-transfer protein 13-like [Populus alba x Populus x berolinensis]|nr:non-specific lipid-transfer protein 13-like [Populus alba x Populus x berolinensis]